MNRYDVVYASDDNYAPVMGTSVYSLLKNNTNLDDLIIHVLSNGMNDDNKIKLEDICKKFSRNIFFYNVDEKVKKIERKEAVWNLTIYARLFIPEILAPDIEKVLYIDGDTLIIGEIKELLEWPMDEEHIIYGVLDRYNVGSIQRLNINTGIYINSGITLMNMVQWRKYNISAEIMKRMNEQEWLYPDQDLLNVVLNGRIGILPMKYNMYMFSRVMPYESAKKLSCTGIDKYYSEEDYYEAQANTAVIHFAGSLFNRPWQKNSRQTDHELFEQYYLQTPWRDLAYQKRKYTNKKLTSAYFWIWEKILWKSWKNKNYKSFISQYQLMNHIPKKIKDMREKHE